MIPVVKPYFPNKKKLARYIDRVYHNASLSNNGPLAQELKLRLEAYLGVENLLLVANGTLALQVAYKALGVNGSAITSPFSFVATASSLKWEGIRPIFSDIDSESLCLDPRLLPQYASGASALVPVHVFGRVCHVDEYENYARKHKLRLIYDGAHAFGVQLGQHSALSLGDATTLSFHATKLFHTGEGGAVIFRDSSVYDYASKLINFGFDDAKNIVHLGVNAKMSELQAAMGLAVLDDIELIVEQRHRCAERYQKRLANIVEFPCRIANCSSSNAYFPVLFQDEADVVKVLAALKLKGVVARRYFYPALNTLAALGEPVRQKVAESVAERIVCLPLYPDLKNQDIDMICDLIAGEL